MHGATAVFFAGDIYSPLWFNPASFGTWNKFSATAGIAFSPSSSFQSTAFFGNSDFKFTAANGEYASGTGISFNHYRIADHANTSSASVHSNFQLEVKKVYISAGLSAGIKNITFDSTGFIPPTNVPDPNIPHGSQSKLTLGAGIMVYSENFYVGLSGIQLNSSRYNEINFNDAPHFILNGGYQAMIT